MAKGDSTATWVIGLVIGAVGCLGLLFVAGVAFFFFARVEAVQKEQVIQRDQAIQGQIIIEEHLGSGLGGEGEPAETGLEPVVPAPEAPNTPLWASVQLGMERAETAFAEAIAQPRSDEGAGADLFETAWLELALVTHQLDRWEKELRAQGQATPAAVEQVRRRVMQMSLSMRKDHRFLPEDHGLSPLSEGPDSE